MLIRLPPLWKGPLLDRLYARIDVRGVDECHPWVGGITRGGWREVDYGCIREGAAGSRLWRVHRLVLILKTAPVDVPPDDDELFIDWLHRAARHYRGREAAHTCDWSLCANDRHLVWQTHTENVQDAARRRRAGDEEIVDNIVKELRRARTAAAVTAR